jgi:hypothetical protein
MHWVPRGTGTPKDRDEVKRREVTVTEILDELTQDSTVKFNSEKLMIRSLIVFSTPEMIIVM